MKIDKSTFEQHVRFFNQGAVIFKENDEGNEMFIIIQGLVEIRKSTGHVLEQDPDHAPEGRHVR